MEKTKLDFVSEVLRGNVEKLLTKLKCSTVYFSQEDVTYCINESGVTVKQDLSSNQEEADTKVILHCHHALEESLSSKVVLRSPSGDTDIMILALSFLESSRTYIDYGNGKSRKGFWLNEICSINEDQKKSLVGFHAFTGNDYISSFFRKSKPTCWNVLNKNRIFIESINQLGEDWNIDMSDTIIAALEQFVCALYSYPREKSVNVVRNKLFEKNIRRKVK